MKLSILLFIAFLKISVSRHWIIVLYLTLLSSRLYRSFAVPQTLQSIQLKMKPLRYSSILYILSTLVSSLPTSEAQSGVSNFTFISYPATDIVLAPQVVPLPRDPYAAEVVSAMVGHMSDSTSDRNELAASDLAFPVFAECLTGKNSPSAGDFYVCNPEK